MTWEPESQSWPPHWQHTLETDRRLTKVELQADGHAKKIETHEKRHDDQDTWNKAFTVALAGLSAGIMHAKASDILDLALSLLQRFKL
jgi:hypothetical protein